MGGSTDFPGIPDGPHAGGSPHPGDPVPTLPTVASPAAAYPPPAPFDAVPALPVLPVEPVRKRRTGLLVGVGVVAALAVGGGAFALFGKDDAAAAYSLRASAQAASEVDAFSMTMSVKTEMGEMQLDADMLTEQQLMRMTMDMGDMIPGQAGEIELILDQKNKNTFMSSEFFTAMGLPIDTPWILLDEEFMRDNGGGSAFDSSLNVDNPLSVAPLLEAASKVEDLGLETFEGEQVKHFVVTVDSDEVVKAAPQIQQQVEELGVDLPAEVVYDVYVTEANEIRRLVYTLDLGGQIGDMGADMVLKRLDSPLVIDVPTESEYTDLGDLL